MKTKLDALRYQRAVKKHQRRHRPTWVERIESAIKEYTSVNAVVFAIIAVPVAVAIVFDAGTLFTSVERSGYQIPVAYLAGTGANGSVTILVRAKNWRPVGDRRLDMADTIEIRVDPDPLGPDMATLYRFMFDGTGRLQPPYEWDRIERVYRLDPELTVQEMGNRHDVIVPDQDRTIMPLGFIQCTRQAEHNDPEPMCWQRFDHEGKRWRIRFARQYVVRHAVFRSRAIALFDRFRV